MWSTLLLNARYVLIRSQVLTILSSVPNTAAHRCICRKWNPLAQNSTKEQDITRINNSYIKLVPREILRSKFRDRFEFLILIMQYIASVMSCCKRLTPNSKFKWAPRRRQVSSNWYRWKGFKGLLLLLKVFWTSLRRPRHACCVMNMPSIAFWLAGISSLLRLFKNYIDIDISAFPSRNSWLGNLKSVKEFANEVCTYFGSNICTVMRGVNHKSIRTSLVVVIRFAIDSLRNRSVVTTIQINPYTLAYANTW